MKETITLRLYLFLLLISIVWVILGAPLLPAEWEDIPHRLALMSTQLPGRMASIFTHWR